MCKKIILTFVFIISVFLMQSVLFGKEIEKTGKKQDVELDMSIVTKKPVTKVEPISVKPTLDYHDFRFQIELQVDKKREEQIDYLNNLIRLESEGSNELAGFLHRLGELYWENAQSFSFKAFGLDDKLHSAKTEAERIQYIERKRKFFKQSKKYREKAIRLYMQVINDFNFYSRMDEVVYSLAYNLDEEKKSAEALVYYRKLIKNHPDSKFIPDGWLAFGEFYFNEGNVDKALASFKKILKFPNSRIYGFALYRIGWCYYNIGEFPNSLKMFKMVIELGKAGTKKHQKSRITLQKEARKDFVLVYSHVGTAKKAKSYFSRVGRSVDMPFMLEYLADLFFLQGKDDECISLYRELVGMNKKTEKQIFYNQRIMEATVRTEKKDLILKEIVQFKNNLHLYLKQYNTQAKDLLVKEEVKGVPTQLWETVIYAEKMLRNLALIYHKEARKTLSDDTFLVTGELYEHYLSFFPNSKYAYKIRFYNAELLYRVAEFERAANNYNAVLMMDPEKGKFRDQAAHSSVLSYEELMKKPKGSRHITKKDTDNLQVEDIPDIEKGLLNACEQYLKYLPEGKYKPDILYKVAHIYYIHNHFNEALTRFEQFIATYPDHKLSEYAANLILDTYNLKKDYENLYLKCEDMISKNVNPNPEFKKKLYVLMEGAAFKRIEGNKVKKDDKKMAEEYMVFVQQNKGSKYSDKALYNAALRFDKASLPLKAISSREQLVKEYPKSSLTEKTAFLLAGGYEDIAQYKKAASMYENYMKKYPKGKNIKDALINAAIYREALGHYKKAIKLREQYLDKFPKTDESHLIFFSIASVQEKQKKPKNANKTYKKYMKKYSKKDINKKLQSLLNIGLNHKKMKDHKKADKYFLKTVRTFAKLQNKSSGLLTHEGIETGAQAAFLLAENDYKSFSKIKISGTGKRLEKSLGKKADALDKAEKSYRKVVGFKHAEWQVASLYRIGELYMEFAKSLMEAPVPRKLTESQRDAYRQLLQEKAVPIEDKAVDGFSKCLIQAFKFSIYSDWTQKTLTALNRLRPSEYMFNAELISESSFVDSI